MYVCMYLSIFVESTVHLYLMVISVICSDDWIKRTISGQDTIVVMNKLDLIDTSLKCFKSIQVSYVLYSHNHLDYLVVGET